MGSGLRLRGTDSCFRMRPADTKCYYSWLTKPRPPPVGYWTSSRFPAASVFFSESPGFFIDLRTHASPPRGGSCNGKGVLEILRSRRQPVRPYATCDRGGLYPQHRFSPFVHVSFSLWFGPSHRASTSCDGSHRKFEYRGSGWLTFPPRLKRTSVDDRRSFQVVPSPEIVMK